MHNKKLEAHRQKFIEKITYILSQGIGKDKNAREKQECSAYFLFDNRHPRHEDENIYNIYFVARDRKYKCPIKLGVVNIFCLFDNRHPRDHSGISRTSFFRGAPLSHPTPLKVASRHSCYILALTGASGYMLFLERTGRVGGRGAR